MKRKYIHMVLMLIFLSVISCTEENSEYFPQLYVSYTPAVTASTRAPAGEYPQDTPFGVWIYSLHEKKTWESNKHEATLLASNSIVRYTDGGWTNTPPIEWLGNQHLTVFAYSPYEIDADYSSNKGITIENFDITEGIHPLFANSAVDCTSERNGGCIAIPFIPTLAKVEFRVRSMAQADSILCLRSLTMDDMYYKGRFQSFPRAKWTPTDDTLTLEFCNNSMMIESSSETVGSQMVLPQRVWQPVTLIVDIYDREGNLLVPGRKIVSRQMDSNWNVGKYYSYTLNVTTNAVTFTTDILENL